ncbi:MAG: EF-hand domain-containing protein [Rhodocyclaceae bacterium]
MNLNAHAFRRIARCAAVGLFLSSGAAMAAEGGAEPLKLKAQDFQTIDTNHDGYIDNKEAAAVPDLAKVFKSADKDRDGKLSPSEFQTVVMN